MKDLQAEIFEQRQLFSQSIASAIFAKHANVFLEDFSSLSAGRCSAGKMNGFLMNYDGLLYKCGMASCGIPENKAIGHIGNLKTNGVAEIDELKNSRFLAIAKPGEQCETCPWLPRCLMSNCPLSHAKGEKLRCIKEYMGKSYIEDILWNMYSCRKYIDLI